MIRTSTFLTALLLRTSIFSTGFQAHRSATTSTIRNFSLAMAETKVGDSIPSIKLTELTASSPEGKPQTVDLAELCKGKKVAIFGVPGAFTPGCSKSHLPSFITAQTDLKTKGVDMTVCVATNDAYVMEVRFL